ncbi:glyoxalase-like protein [Palleronia aestuarii]|uniref:Glyoxalase-like protein n=1 Tax=Palleronia aestuarii TaxID=568105 RepID=A0A2W7NDR8_9RHOB|nr:VOC family protein [Palleronia aestuarii]PZX16297.1 glyoxalase-like protein [Palleronia aestuarii]
MRIDHLVVTAPSLEAGSDHVAEALGVAPGPGGRHDGMGTHNLLLSLGPEVYIEVIAVDPDAPEPSRARMFGLDADPGAPRLASWVARCDDLRAEVAQAPDMLGEIIDLARGDLSWSMTAPPGGRMPYDGIAPPLISWTGGTCAQDLLPPSDLRFERLILRHPRSEELQLNWPVLGQLDRVTLEPGPVPSLEAEILTAMGMRRLSSAVAAG